MPHYVPDAGYWGACCVDCGWCVLYRAHYGDRPEDLFFVQDEDVPDEYRTWMRERVRELELCEGVGASRIVGFPGRGLL